MVRVAGDRGQEPAQGPAAEVSQALGELVGDFKLHFQFKRKALEGLNQGAL